MAGPVLRDKKRDEERAHASPPLFCLIERCRTTDGTGRARLSINFD